MRRLFILLGAAGVFVALVLVSLPWWWGAVLRLGGARMNVEFGEYQRIGYARWAVTGVRWSGAAGDFSAGRIELPHPLRLALGRSEAGRVQLEEWSWISASPGNPPGTDGEETGGWRPAFDRLAQAMYPLQRWLPPVEARVGVIGFADRRIQVGRAAWEPSNAQLTFDGLAWGEVILSGEAVWDSDAANWTGRLTSADAVANFELTPAGARLNGTWWRQAWTASAEFAPTGWRPEVAALDAANWVLPGERLGLAGRYAEIRVEGHADWVNGRLDFTVTADGAPVEGSELPPLKVMAAAHGSPEAVTITALDVIAPGVTAHLSQSVTMGTSDQGETWRTPATFAVAADLAILTRDAIQGKLNGKVDLEPTTDAWPRLKAVVATDALRWRDWPEVTGRGEATLEDRVLSVQAMKFVADDASQISLAGKWDLKTRTASDVVAQGQVARRWVARWLPEQVVFSTFAVEMKAAGTWPELNHQGTVRAADITIGPLKPSQWTLDWTGVGLARVEGTLVGQAGQSGLSLTAQKLDSGAELSALTLRRADGEELSLTQPVSLAWQPAFRLEQFELQGAAERLRFSLPAPWHLEFFLTHLGKPWLEDWLHLPAPDWSVETLQVSGAMADGVWLGRLEARAAVEIGNERAAQIALAANFGPDGVAIEQGEISEEQQPILLLTGNLPLTLTPGAAGTKWLLNDSAPLSAEISSVNNPAFWAQFHAITGIEFEAPALAATLQGTWKNPAGEISLGAAKVRFDPDRWGTHWPELAQLRARLSGDDEGLILDTLAVEIFGQAVHASGRLPLERDKLFLLRDDPWAFLRQLGEGKLEVPDADLARWSALAPQVLAPTGRLQLSVRASPGGRLDGTLRLSDAATRPIGPLGAIQDITADMRFADRTMTIESIEAQTGGRPVMLTGDVTWPAAGAPVLNLLLKGDNLPFVRQTGLLLRGDVDLKLQTDANGATWVRGGVNLRDGLLLMDLQALRPGQGGGSSAAGRPPYFSVEELPFADWRLEVKLQGRRFMRVETPVFSGRASADFQMHGTLREPRAVGELTVPRGWVKLPFASFEVTEGWIRLQQNDPHVVRLAIVGAARRMGYDLRMELTGTANEPKLQFFSSPPLSSDEVLLLVMAGEAPQNEINSSAAQRAARLGAYLGQSLINQYTGRIGEEDRLKISAGDRITREGRETYLIEYDLGRRWSLIGEYDEFDDYNAGLKREIFSSRRKEETDDR